MPIVFLKAKHKVQKEKPMAKKPNYKTERCGHKYVLKNTVKPKYYLKTNGKLTPFADDNTLMFTKETDAANFASILNNAATTLSIKDAAKLFLNSDAGYMPIT